jgi:hypothetical protein
MGDSDMAKLVRFLQFVGRDFLDFLIHQKRWWLTALLLTLAAFIGLIVLTEPQGVRPIIYDQ